MIFLRSAAYAGPPEGREREYPFCIPLLESLEAVEFKSSVTLLVGENGSGKSTFIEAIAAATGSVAAGGASVRDDATLGPARRLGKSLRLTWGKKTHRGFFLRSEDFFNFVRRTAELRAEMEEELRRVEKDYEGRSEYAKSFARMPYSGSLSALEGKYGGDLGANSHGESFLKFFQARFVPGGLYILDEPEVPLSPLRQLSLISMLNEMAADSQFIIATHSPILMAAPGATILNFDEAPPKEARYDELQHVNITRDFLNNPQAFLRNL